MRDLYYDFEVVCSEFSQLVLLLVGNSWIKFEEDVEDGGNRWTKPFVGTLSLHALFELRSSLLNGSLVLDAQATSVTEVISVLVEQLGSTYQLTTEQKNQVGFALTLFCSQRTFSSTASF